MPDAEIAVLGFGAVGRATVELLGKRKRSVRVAQRTQPSGLPSFATFLPCDILSRENVERVVAGARQVVLAVGMPYQGTVWRYAWPKAMANVLDACQKTGARLVFVDNLYMYGPQSTPLREDMPLTSFGIKPAVRAGITRMWMKAVDDGRVLATALRAPDFYGPGVLQSHLGETAFGALAKGKRAALVAPPDTPHDFAYVPDFARAVVTLLDAADPDFGQAWHVPCAATSTPRQMLALGAKALGVTPRLAAVPLWMLPALGLFSPMMREFVEMRFQWDRPYHVDSGKFKRRFWSDATPFEIGMPTTALSFRG
jgi:nucleoside-diphosphate-sugar epimerase